MSSSILVFTIFLLIFGQFEVLSEASVMIEYSKEQLFLLKRRGLSVPDNLPEVPGAPFLFSAPDKTSLTEKLTLILFSKNMNRILKEHNATCPGHTMMQNISQRAAEAQSLPFFDDHVMQELTIIETLPFSPEWVLSNILGLTEMIYNLKCEMRGEDEAIFCLQN
ncbi:unnamed protein product [Phytomonas sp. Hart1]|nr:unnamed protein product [Phytomonas sp. Hart1]|eukprot:CCW70825.1 unnamed protein product [Phytomonas sp. isolate Hart1]